MSTSSKVALTSISQSNSKSPKVRKQMSIKYRFKRWLRNWINHEENLVAAEPTRLVESTELDSNQPMRITIHRAAGGMVIETRTYDRIKDRNNQNLHIITHEQNLAEGLSKIITMESLRA